jgi:1,4-alpha-glucan branching enzyme
VNLAARSYDAYRIGLPRGGLWRVRFNGDWGGYSGAFTNHRSFDCMASAEDRDGMPFAGDVGIGPYSAVILSQDE